MTILQLLSFEKINGWIYWLKKRDIHWAWRSKWVSVFFKSQLIHTFTESKDKMFLDQGVLSEMFYFELLKK
jgi:hypothetical protein